VNPGILYALGAYLLWGVLPLYLHLLGSVSAMEILAHRIVWSLVTVAILLAVLGRRAWLRRVIEQPALLRRFAVTAGFITVNWLLYIWSIGHGHVVDASLGYFMNPLVNVVMGALLLHERLRGWQKASVLLAALGVAWLTWQAGSPPWIGLVLAVSFSMYGWLRRTAALGAIEGFALEAALLAPLALGYLLWLWLDGSLVFAQSSTGMRLLLACAGPATTVPLLLFAAGARRIPFSLLGILQYLAPTLQWMTGVFVFHEVFDPHKAAGFGLIWLALVIYAAESAWVGLRQSRAPGNA